MLIFVLTILIVGVILLSLALDNLTSNIAKLSTDVDTLIAAHHAGPTEAEVQAQADAVAAIDAKVSAATS